MAMVGLLSYAPKSPTPISLTNKNVTSFYFQVQGSLLKSHSKNPLGNLLLLPLPSLADMSSAKEAFRRRKSQSALPVKICRRRIL